MQPIEHPTAEQFLERLAALRTEEQAQKYLRYFKTGEGQYGAGDVFLGVPMGQVFGLAKECIAMPPEEIERLLESDIHEARAGGLSIMDKQARSKKTPAGRRKELYELYLRRHDRINNWDLVDVACIHVVGGYLWDKPRDVLYQLARSANLWERRTAIVSTAYFLKQGEQEDTFQIAELLLDDKEDLIHKAVGGWLRAAGDQDRPRLLRFLDQHAARMPRVMLRYAIEHFEQDQRDQYLGRKK